MKREFLTSLELEKDVIDKIMAENGSDIEREKAKITPLQEKIGTYETQLAKFKDVDIDTIKAELIKLKKDEADRVQAELKAKEDSILTDAITAVIDGKEFVNDYTKQSILSDIKSELAKSENKGKGAKDIFEVLTKDKEGIFKNPNQPLVVPPVGKVNGAQITAEQFAKMGYTERVKVKSDDPKLYETLKGE